MTVILLFSLGALVVGVILAWRSSRRLAALAAVVLLVPLALSLPTTLDNELEEFRWNRQLPVGNAEVSAPLLMGARRAPTSRISYRFLTTVARVVPPGAEIGVRLPVDDGFVRFAAFALAPRLLVNDVDSEWVILRGESPDDAGRTWRVGDYALVQR